MNPEILPLQLENFPEPRGWHSLLPELIQHVARFLSANEVACSLRPLCHSTASALGDAQHKTVLLSKWAPQHAYAERWGSPGAIRSLTRKRRGDLVRLTSVSGSVQNLALAVVVTGYPLTHETVKAAAGAGLLEVLHWLHRLGLPILFAPVMAAAAAGGHLDVCTWMRKQGCPLYPTEPLESAAAAGRREVCAWLLTNGCPWSRRAVSAAAAGGHVSLMDWLLQQRSAAGVVAEALEGVNPQDLVVDSQQLAISAARGCPLPVLQRVHREWAEAPGGWWARIQQEGDDGMSEATTAAAASSTADWAAKVTWLQEERGYPLTAEAYVEVTARCPTDEEVMARLTWLHGRGCEVDCMADALEHAAGRDHAASLQYLLELEAASGVMLGGDCVVTAAARNGNLACLLVLHTTAGVDMYPADAVEHAARGGHLPAVRWLVETLGVKVQLTAGVAAAAAHSGSLELLSYLRERGCPWDVRAWKNVVEQGSEEMQDWAREHGCPTQ